MKFEIRPSRGEPRTYTDAASATFDANMEQDGPCTIFVDGEEISYNSLLSMRDQNQKISSTLVRAPRRRRR